MAQLMISALAWPMETSGPTPASTEGSSEPPATSFRFTAMPVFLVNSLFTMERMMFAWSRPVVVQTTMALSSVSSIRPKVL